MGTESVTSQPGVSLRTLRSKSILVVLQVTLTLLAASVAVFVPPLHAQTSPLTIQPSTGHVGIGTTNPATPLEIKSTYPFITLTNTGVGGGSWKINVGAFTTNNLFSIDHGASSYPVLIASDGAVAVYSPDASTYLGVIPTGGLPGYPGATYPTLKTNFPYLYFSIGDLYSGYLTSGGVLYSVSSRDRKENFTAVDPLDILAKIEQLSIARWNYNGDDPQVTHIAPVAEDFNALFGFQNPPPAAKLGLASADPVGGIGIPSSSPTGEAKVASADPVGVPGIASIDPPGIALVGIKALAQKLRDQTQQIAALQADLAALKRQLNVTSSPLPTTPPAR